jgi:hypothetical protein
MATGGLLLYVRLPPRAARRAWLALALAGLANALVLSLLPENLVNINVVHHYLGAKYAFSYRSFYQLINAAVERPQVAMRDLDHPPAMVRDDPRAQRAYYIDLMRQAAVEFDSAPLPGSPAPGGETGTTIVNRNGSCASTSGDDRFRRDARRALWVEKRSRTSSPLGATSPGTTGSTARPCTLVRRLDPTLHRPSAGDSRTQLAGQIAVG